MARLEPLASTSSAVGFVQGHVSRPTHVARCWRGHTCPYHARKCCCILHDEDGEGSACAATARAAFPLPPASLLVRLSSLLEQMAEVLKVIQQRIVEPIVDGPVPLAEFVGVWEQIVDVPVLRTMEDDVGVVRSTPQERVQNRVLEQIVGVLVPHTMEDGLPVVPQERVLHRTQEQIVGVPVPQIVEERVQHRTQEQIADSLVPPIMEAVLPSAPQERVQNLTQELVQNCSFVRQITEEIGDGVQQVLSKRSQNVMGIATSRVWTSTTCLVPVLSRTLSRQAS